MYLATGLEVLVAVKCGGMAGAALACLLGAGEEEQPPRVRANAAATNAAGKCQPSRMESIIPAPVCDLHPGALTDQGRSPGNPCSGDARRRFFSALLHS